MSSLQSPVIIQDGLYVKKVNIKPIRINTEILQKMKENRIYNYETILKIKEEEKRLAI